MDSPPNVGRYVIESEIGRGGFGAVYRARHGVLDRRVALKVLHPQRSGSTEVLQRFLREARSVAQLKSPHIVQVVDADVTSEGRAFIAMELLEGEDLAQRLERTGRLPTHRVIRIGREILAGLAVAHAQGVVHRDLKPGNVFLAKGPGGDEIAKILDFGISTARTEDPKDELTRTGTMLGTPHYMAPEQFRAARSVDARADLYSLGTLLYEALTARMPYEATTLHQLIAVKLTEPPRPLGEIAPDVPRAVADVVMRALADEPAQRYASAAEMDVALAKVEGATSMPGVVLGATPSVPPLSLPPTSTLATKKPGPSWLVRILAGAALLAALLGLVMLVLTGLGVWIAEREIRAWMQGDPATDAAPPEPTTEALPAPTFRPQPQGVALPPSPPRLAAEPVSPTDLERTPTDPVRAAGVEGVHVTTSALGSADADAIASLARRAEPMLARCRGPRAYRADLNMVVQAGGGLMRSAAPETDPTHDCVVDALRASGPAGLAPGIAQFHVSLDPS